MLFNSKGELNASSLKDAFSVIAKYASLMDENTPSSMNLVGAPGLTDGQKDELLAQAMLTNDGKISLAQAMANPIN